MTVAEISFDFATSEKLGILSWTMTASDMTESGAYTGTVDSNCTRFILLVLLQLQ